ncbi:MAG: hypothetical protein F6K55_27580 [Moorea sp. SIO4A3]|nr:hypothetical protein [Moorena sp. SIO4A3]
MALISNALANTDSSYHTYEVHKIFSLLPTPYSLLPAPCSLKPITLHISELINSR